MKGRLKQGHSLRIGKECRYDSTVPTPNSKFQTPNSKLVSGKTHFIPDFPLSAQYLAPFT